MMKRRISSEWSYFEKWAGLIAFGGGGLLLIVQVLLHLNEVAVGGPLLFIIVWLTGASLACWHAWTLKHVSVDEDSLYVTNYWKEVVVPLSDVGRVTYFGFSNIRIATIHLRRRSEFGAKIRFSPPYRFFGGGEPPEVKELRGLAKAQEKRAAVS